MGREKGEACGGLLVEHELEEGCESGEEEVDVRHMLLELGMLLSELEFSHKQVVEEVEVLHKYVEEVVEEVEVPHRQVEVVRSSQQACLGTVLLRLLPPRSPAQKQLVRMISRGSEWTLVRGEPFLIIWIIIFISMFIIIIIVDLGQGGAVAHAVAVPENGHLPLLLQKHWALREEVGTDWNETLKS